MKQNKTKAWSPLCPFAVISCGVGMGEQAYVVYNSRNKVSNDKHNQAETQIANLSHLFVSNTKKNKTRYCSPTLSRCCDLTYGARLSRRTRTIKHMGKSWVHSKNVWRASSQIGLPVSQTNAAHNPYMSLASMLPLRGRCCDVGKGRRIEEIKSMG